MVKPKKMEPSKKMMKTKPWRKIEIDFWMDHPKFWEKSRWLQKWEAAAADSFFESRERVAAPGDGTGFGSGLKTRA